MNLNNAAELLTELSVQTWRELSNSNCRVFTTNSGQVCAFVQVGSEFHFLNGANLDEGSQEAPITDKAQLWYLLNEQQNESYRDFFFKKLCEKYEVGTIQYEFEILPYESGPTPKFMTYAAKNGLPNFKYIDRDDSDFCITGAFSVDLSQEDANELYKYFPPNPTPRTS